MYEDLDQLVTIKKRLRIYSGSSNPKLAADIAKILGVEVDGLVLEQFANGEIYARFDETVRGCDGRVGGVRVEMSGATGGEDEA